LRQKHYNLIADRNELPRIKQWRLNLTALSKVYNLYFVAYSDRIYVYRPNFPNQSLPLKPAIILNPVKTSEARGGYIDTNDPHSINNVLIDFFGDLEIILIACDDGDVIGYYTHKIEDAINRLSTEEATQDLSFFAVNVSLSAWGLSIHSTARKIAISSNSTNITIFALGLVCPSDPWVLPRPVPEDLLEWHKSVLADPKWRGDDQKFVLGKWGHNIPSVAFCNNDEDIEGRLLAFGEIMGNIYILDLHKLKSVETMRTGFCRRHSGYVECGCAEDHYPHAIWGLSWLDRKSFHKVSRQMLSDQSSSGFSRAWNGSDKTSIVPDANPGGHMSYFPSMAASSTTGLPPSQGMVSGRSEADESAYTSGIESSWTEEEKTTKNSMMSTTPTTDEVCDAEDLKWMPVKHSRRGSAILGIRSAQMEGGNKAEIFSFEENPKHEPNHRDSNYPCPLFVASKSDACLIQPRDHLNRLTPIIGYLDPLNQWVILNDNIREPPWFFSETAMNSASSSSVPQKDVLPSSRSAKAMIERMAAQYIGIAWIGFCRWTARRTTATDHYRN